MNERPPLEMPDSLESHLQHVDFRLNLTHPIPGLVTYEGIYTNAEKQRFVLTLAALKDDRYLTRYREELQVAFLALPADAPSQGEHAEKNERVRRPLAQLIEEGVHDEGGDRLVLGLEVRCDSLPDAARHRERPELVTVFGRIDPWILAGRRHCYHGPDRVVAACAPGNVTLGGLTHDPTQVAVPPTADRDANCACWVQGVAKKSHYQLDAAWYRVAC
jgi:hypothetical protein